MDHNHHPLHDPKPNDNRGRLSPTPTNVEQLTRSKSDQSGSLNPSTSTINVHGIQVPVGEVGQPDRGPIRWAILAAACLVMFGNYYAFDNPAALNSPLQEYMRLPNDEYAYFLNLLYTSYSIPNVILPWLGGYASDKLGHRRLLISLSIIVALGHMTVCLGLDRRNIPVMIVGRVMFGAAESLAVAQSAVTVKYFRGKELAMALGVNLCVSRLGSVLNDVLTPFIWSRSSVPVAFWFGFLSCVLSLATACLLVWLDMKYGGSNVAEPLDRSRPSSCLIDARLSVEGLRPPASTIGKSEDSSLEKQITFKSMLEEEPNYDGNRHHDEEDHTFRQCFKSKIRELLDYSLSFWILCAMAFLLVGIIVPFNSIHAGFLQMRWYPGDPLKAAQIMTVPDLLSAALILPIGYFVDHFGRKSWLFMLNGLIIGFCHIVLGTMKIPSPVPCLIALGIASAIGAIFSSAIPILVRNDQLGTAYGIMASAFNLAFVVFPIIVAKLMTVDPAVYTYVEIFFSCIGFLGFMLAIWLKLLDRNGAMDRREIDNHK